MDIIGDTVDKGKDYLISQVHDGVCSEFHQLGHGPSVAWTTACVASTLSEFNATPPETLQAIRDLQWDNGGWSYNQASLPDADTTLRVLQYLKKIKFDDVRIMERAEKFVIAHQQRDGGIATYFPKDITAMGYSGKGWISSHPCVTALAINILRDAAARQKAREYLDKRLWRGDARSYWWQTPWYVLYEAQYPKLDKFPMTDKDNDPVEISLYLLLKARLGMLDQVLSDRLRHLQLPDGSFPISRQFRLPRPQQMLDTITGSEEVVEDKKRVFSTSAAIVALSRQKTLQILKQ